MGIIGAKISILYLSWGQLSGGNGDAHMVFKRKMEACQSIFWVFIIFSMGMDNPLVDNWAHLGGLIAGMLCGGYLFSDEAVLVQENTAGGRPATMFQKAQGKLCGGALVGVNLLLLGLLFTVTRKSFDVPQY